MKFLSIKNLGTFLIVLSLGFFVILSYPLVRAYFFSHPYVEASTPSEQFMLFIPKIHAQSPVVENVDPWNEAIYQEALRHGVAHAKSTALPGEKKTIFLFAHSSGSPWDQISTNTIFLRLGELQKGDEIIVERNKKRYIYRVFDKKEVFPSETKYLKPQEKNQIILQTCTPIGTSLKRLLVFAEPK